MTQVALVAVNNAVSGSVKLPSLDDIGSISTAVPMRMISRNPKAMVCVVVNLLCHFFFISLPLILSPKHTAMRSAGTNFMHMLNAIFHNTLMLPHPLLRPFADILLRGHKIKKPQDRPVIYNKTYAIRNFPSSKIYTALKRPFLYNYLTYPISHK